MCTITRDWSRDGFLIIEGAKTLETYEKLKYHNLPDASDFNCFWAFSKDQYSQGMESCGIKAGELVVHAGMGLFGRPDDLHSFDDAIEARHAQIRETCDPQEAYYFEWNNHESMYTDDTNAFSVIRSIWGDRAENIRRLSY